MATKRPMPLSVAHSAETRSRSTHSLLTTPKPMDTRATVVSAMHDYTEKGTHHEPHHITNPTIQPTLAINLHNELNTITNHHKRELLVNQHDAQLPLVSHDL